MCKFVKLLLLVHNRANREVDVLCGYHHDYPEPDVIGGWCRLHEQPRDSLVRHVTAQVPPNPLAGDIVHPVLNAHLLLRPQEQGVGSRVEHAVHDPTGLLPENFHREYRVFIWALDAATLRGLLNVNLIQQFNTDWRPLRAFAGTLPPYYRRAVWYAARSVFPTMTPDYRLD